MFANPDRENHFLAGVIREAGIVIEETASNQWWVHGETTPAEQQSLRGNFRARHNTGNVVWVMGHGGDAEDEFEIAGEMVRVTRPSLKLLDGCLSTSRLVQEGYDFTGVELAHFSSCLLGRLDQIGASKELEGFIATMTLLGCRRVMSAIWPLADEAAAEFARHWIRALKTHVFREGPRSRHAFAIAFKEALTNFRKAENRRFDHEFYWAPYALYGLG